MVCIPVPGAKHNALLILAADKGFEVLASRAGRGELSQTAFASPKPIHYVR